MLGLTVHGEPRPIDAGAIANALGARFAVLPENYLQLMTRWGAGWLCGVFELPDPSEPTGRFDLFGDSLRVNGPAQRRAGQWAQLADDELARGVVLGVDRYGRALFAVSPAELVLLAPNGTVRRLGTFERVISHYLLAPEPRDGPLGQLYEWNVALDVGVPALHIPRFGAERIELRAALAADDEDAADAALQRVLGAEVALFALLELAAELAGPASQPLPRELRASYLDQCLRMAKRRAPGVVKDTPIRELRTALEAGELAPALLAQATVLAAPAGMFVATMDATERALLDELAARPDDAATRLVYADHLEARGDVVRAEELRAEASAAPPLPNARERGFIAPPGLPPINVAMRIRTHAARWRADDPTTSIEPLLAHVAGLHPTARQGYELLAAQLDHWQHGAAASQHLLRELPDAWPQLVLGLREPRASPQLLVDNRIMEAAPYLLAIALRPSAETRRVAMAEAFLELGGELDAALVEQLLPHTRADAEPGLRAVAFVLLRDSAADDRVFDAYLAGFCEAHPHSEHALKKRRKDPRVLETLLAALTREEDASLADGRHLRYTPEYGILAKYLSRLGNARGREASKRFQQRSRWGKGGWPEEL